MIYAAIQIVALLFSSFMLVRFHAGAKHCRWRPFISIIAAAWTALATMCAVAILLSWPEAISKSNFFTAAVAVLSAYLAWWCGGNVAELIRKIDRVIQ